MREVKLENGKVVTYMNSGDWVEHLSALEYHEGKWSVFQYNKLDFDMTSPHLQVPEPEANVFTLRREEVVPELNGIAAFEAF
jgi:hypothetical protein